MAEHPEHTPGSFVWTDLATTDTSSGSAFYQGVFGWGASPSTDPEMPYTVFQLGGRDVGGIGPLAPDQAAQGVPPHWLVYVAAADAGAACVRAAGLGAAVLAGPFDVKDLVRMAVLRDPQGAVFALWQPGTHHGFAARGEVGSPCWFELMTPDSAAARAFYCGLFGWGTKESTIPGVEYHEWQNGGESIGGLMPMTGPGWSGVPPQWVLYVSVADCDTTVARVKELGGSVRVPPFDAPGVGRMSVVGDPQGATFSVIALAATA